MTKFIMSESPVLNSHPELLKIGDKVTTAFIHREGKVVRVLLDMESDPTCSSGFRAWSDAGDGGTPIPAVDSSWFLQVKDVVP